MTAFLTDPAAITAESFRRIDAFLVPYGLGDDVYPIVRRVVHTTADFEWVSSLRCHPRAVEAAVAALREGAAIVTDVRMVATGIGSARVRGLGGAVHCAVDDPAAARLAAEAGITRSMAALRLLARQLPRALYVVGNAPTALFEFLRLRDEGVIAPPAVIGVPVGFVSTVEAKTALMRTDELPWISNVGPKGGSAVAAAIVNALLELAEDGG
ncbi:MAG: precorrin-8X methylmutase [Chloroflexota bacterium]|nr:precorrin-8X methylmutase [Chloroflexota bacterium]